MKNFIISRTDKIGDVILTLPLAVILKKQFPESEIIFLGNSYTKPVLECASYIDKIVEWDEMEKKPEKEIIQQLKDLEAHAILHVFPQKKIAKTAFSAGIPLRIGTSHRLFHLLYCNGLVNFGRKNSKLHETQLNLKLLKPLFTNNVFSLEDLSAICLFDRLPAIDNAVSLFIDKNRKNIIFHPHSRGSAREWPLEYYVELSNLLPEDEYNVIFAGTESEAIIYRNVFPEIKRQITDVGGKLSLQQYISLITGCQGLVASSTGPLHIAAAAGIHAFGIYPPIRPMHPGRWAPLGKNVHVFMHNKECSDCRKTGDCQCMREIYPQQLGNVIVEKLSFK